MTTLQYFAGFSPKSFMFFLYLPAIGLLVLASIVFLAKKRNGRPYPLVSLASPPAGFVLYLYDKFISKQVDKSQALVLVGVAAVIGMYFLASTSLIPEDQTAVNAMAIMATIISFGIFIAAVIRKGL